AGACGSADRFTWIPVAFSSHQSCWKTAFIFRCWLPIGVLGWSAFAPMAPTISSWKPQGHAASSGGRCNRTSALRFISTLKPCSCVRPKYGAAWNGSIGLNARSKTREDPRRERASIAADERRREYHSLSDLGIALHPPARRRAAPVIRRRHLVAHPRRPIDA